MEIIAGPAVVTRPDRHYAGIRLVTPFRGMLAVRDRLLGELYERVPGVAGPAFLRLHVIDMAGPMDVEVGAVTSAAVDGDDRVRPGCAPGRPVREPDLCQSTPAGPTACSWTGPATTASGWTGGTRPAGDLFACRYEAYLTDPRTEPMKTRWQVELSIRIADQPSQPGVGGTAGWRR